MCYEGGNFTLSHSPPSRKEPLGILSFSCIICFFFLCNLDPFTHPNGQSFYRVSELISLTIFALLLGASVNFHPSTINYHFVFFLRSVISLHVYSCTSLTLDFHMWFFSSSWHIQWGTFLLWSPLVHRSFSERAMWLSHFIFKTLFRPKREVVAFVASIPATIFSSPWSILSHCLLLLLQFLLSWTEMDSLIDQKLHVLMQNRFCAGYWLMSLCGAYFPSNAEN